MASPRRDCWAQVGLQGQLLLAKAVQEGRCWAETAAEVRVQQKMGGDGVGGVDVCVR